MTAGICEREIKMSKTVFKPGTMLNPVPAVMVSCGDDTVNNIITIAWTGIINSESADNICVGEKIKVFARYNRKNRRIRDKPDYGKAGFCG